MHHPKIFGKNQASLRHILATLLALSLIFTTSFAAFAEALQQENQATATVTIAALNVRSGPGVGYTRIGGVKKGDVLTVVGQHNNCSWLQVKTDKRLDGWVSGSTRYITLNGKCSDIPASSAPTQAASETSANQAVAPTAVPAVTPVPATANGERPAWLAPDLDISMAAELEAKLPLEPDKACVLFQNHLNQQILITLTHQEQSFNKDVRLEKNEGKGECIPGGKYTFTISSPGYNSLSYRIKFYAGTRDYFEVHRNY